MCHYSLLLSKVAYVLKAADQGQMIAVHFIHSDLEHVRIAQPLDLVNDPMHASNLPAGQLAVSSFKESRVHDSVIRGDGQHR